MRNEQQFEISAPIDFDRTAPNLMEMHKLDNNFNPQFRKEWPVVYIISNEDEAYVGETVDAGLRMAQHLTNKDRKRLKKVRFISGDRFNKSVILDLEAFLISHMAADEKFKLQNGKLGQKHDYYQKSSYQKQFTQIWEELKKRQIAHKDLKEIENSNLFKYSPYKTLTADQYLIIERIIQTLAQDIEEDRNSTFLVNGGAGTGKTVLGIFLLKMLATPIDDDTDLEDENMIESLEKIHLMKPKLKIGIAVSMTNLRNILSETFKNTFGLHQNMVLRPSEVAKAKEPFDILIVDEAHRLKTTRNIGVEIGSFYQTNREMGYEEKEGTQLDWILKNSKHTIFFYDKKQSIKRADVDAERFEKLRMQPNCHEFKLETQVRCALGGKEYMNYIASLFSNNPPIPKFDFGKYELKLFGNVHDMTEKIRRKDADVGLCRNVAGYAWKWTTKRSKIKPRNYDETQRYIDKGFYDIDIDGYKYIWNTKDDGWSLSPNAVNEIGCVHTIQGFDLNYAGVIIGNELKYDNTRGRFYIDRDQYFDTMGKNATSDDDLLEYILNIYQILCTRGISGTYIYACDESVREYLKKYITMVN